MENTELHEKITAFLDGERDFVVDLTQQLVRYKSVNPNFIAEGAESQESEVQGLLQGVMSGLGLAVESWEDAPGRPNVVGRLAAAGGGGKSLILNGHIDVVPEGNPDDWHHDPFGADIVDGRLYGRGAYDMKGGVAAMVAAVRAVRRVGVDLRGEVQLHTVVDEESGATVGTQSVIRRGYLADAVIVTEPTQGELITAEGGLSWLRVSFRGRPAHSGWRFAQIYPQREGTAGTEGVNAVEKCVKFVAWLGELEREWALSKRHPLLPPGAATLNPGVIVGGAGLGADGRPTVITNPAMIPDTCAVDIDFKYLPTYSFEEAKGEFESYLSAFCQGDPWLREHPPTLTWHLGNINFPPVSTPDDHPLVETVRASRRSLGLDTELIGFPAVTDAAFYAGAGVPAVIYGPAGAGLHGNDEYVVVDSLTEAAKVYAGAILRWCGVA